MRIRVPVIVVLAMAALFSIQAMPAVSATTFTVNSTGDGGDANVGDDVCADSIGECTLRAAIEQANATSGADTIAFGIGTGVRTIAPRTPLPAITDPATIDGTTQPGFAGTPIVELSGVNVQVLGNGLLIHAGDSIVRGLVVNRFTNGIWLAGGRGGNVIEGNFVGTDVTGTRYVGNYFYGIVPDYSSGGNTIGGTTPQARNVISGNQEGIVINTGIEKPGNLVQGNYIGTDVSGGFGVGNSSHGIRIESSPRNVIGGNSAGTGNVISGNGGRGVEIRGFNAIQNIVRGNLIGTNASGLAPLPNASGGVSMFGSPSGASGNTIGGSEPGDGNVISGNAGGGMVVTGDAPGNLILGNFIGTDRTGERSIGNSFGVFIHAPNTSIGGTLRGEGNTIVFNRGPGVIVGALAGHTIRGNSIHSNSGKGIENTSFYEPPAPVITSAGSASGTACAGCIVDVYSDNEDEGRVYHGAATADQSGNWSYEGVVVGPNVTATATDANSSTSEFSAPFSCAQNGADADGDGRCDSGDETQPEDECAGRAVTIRGTKQSDVIWGTRADDVIHGGAGDDVIRGREGNDVICGGDGKDRIFGDKGGDALYGDADDDYLSGGRGMDLLDGGADADRCHGGPGRDSAVRCERPRDD